MTESGVSLALVMLLSLSDAGSDEEQLQILSCNLSSRVAQKSSQQHPLSGSHMLSVCFDCVQSNQIKSNKIKIHFEPIKVCQRTTFVLRPGNCHTPSLVLIDMQVSVQPTCQSNVQPAQAFAQLFVLL